MTFLCQLLNLSNIFYPTIPVKSFAREAISNFITNLAICQAIKHQCPQFLTKWIFTLGEIVNIDGKEIIVNNFMWEIDKVFLNLWLIVIKQALMYELFLFIASIYILCGMIGFGQLFPIALEKIIFEVIFLLTHYNYSNYYY